MKKGLKIIIGLFIALISIGVVAAIALRYLDVLMKPFISLRNAISPDCCCDEDEECECAEWE